MHISYPLIQIKHTLVLFCVSAKGVYLPPFTIYKSKHLYKSWTINGVKGATYACSPNGWMMDYIFEQWFITVFVQFVANYNKPVLLTYDGHNSHLTYTTVKSAMDNNIIIICLPPNTSHALQPLDVAVFRSARKKFKDTLTCWFNETRLQKVDKNVFPQLLKYCWTILDKNHAVVGFKKTGLYPVDRQAVMCKIVGTSSNVSEIHTVGPGRSPGRLKKCNLKRNYTY